MTGEEAYKWFKRRQDLPLDDKCKAAEKIAIYAIETRIPKRPSYFDCDDNACQCPRCLIYLSSEDNIENIDFCPYCGQALDFTETEEE